MKIKEIKSQLTIQQVLQHYHYKPTLKGAMPNGRQAMHCPFHEPKKGSKAKKTFQVYTDTNRYQCFHADCKAVNGDVIDFIELQENCTKHQAIEIAKGLIGNNTDASRHVGKDAQDALRSTEQAIPKDAHSDAQASEAHRPGEKSKVPEGGVFTVPTDRHGVQSTDFMHYLDDHLDISVLGGVKLEGLDRMRCTLKLIAAFQSNRTAQGISTALPAVRHTLDLYNDDQLQKLVRKTAERLEIGTSKIRNALYALTNHLETYRLQELAHQEDDKPTIKPLSEKDALQAINFLKKKGLMQYTNQLLGDSGIVGEALNRQILWMVYSSRKRDNPLHVICLGASGTGKTYLQEKVSRFVPEHEKYTFTAGTENAFYYLEKYDLYHKVVIVEDMDGVQYLLYPLRELQTKNWISKMVPIKDHRGEMKTRKLEVFGPICMSATTTKEKIYEDNANRCILLHLDNSPEQQEAIMDYQRKLSAGKVDSDKENQATKILSDVQRVLKDIKVINPYAESLKIPSNCFKPLRTNQHYLQFIETVTWYHQYQRKEQVDKSTGEIYINTTLEDIAIANDLMKDILLTKSDELPKAIREFFEALKEWLKETNPKDYKKTSFYTKTMRAHFRMYPMKANRYINTLMQYGLLKKAGGNKKTGYEYEVADWEDYRKLKGNINVLDELLNDLKKKESGEENG